MSLERLDLEVASPVLRVVQVTDTHLNESEGGTLLGLDTDFTLQHVLALVKSEREQIDLVLGTGDISDHGSRRAYQRARDYFAQLADDSVWLVGNHDERGAMIEELGHKGALVRVVYAGNWQIVLLDSQMPGKVGGHLGQAELDWLQSCLADAQANNLQVLVCLHHQPVKVGSAWIDEQLVADSADFFAIIDSCAAVRGVLWGHVHQHIDTERNGVRLMSTPSSCIQFAQFSEEFRVDGQSPGYRWLDLHPDGTIDTGVSRVTGVDFGIDLNSTGYA
ncbi:3',5'-cyclic-AMP phosphodiesterase [Halieaceae bacterium IMCC14734]|uniref:3',5'-cyclic-AMP phosphodiesterase n=1 Tax=Candidatus Litorirhabdus singularis TaxID=2518993 RepID=A0ABT3TC90_9GAMM|nr:3',5'-cyclic-AMP phosphodiesterase [Candidatus Litorirhabdus singularis]MCX2979899.1 3',5'-cyclic-AMP phosphodiesterase [Candidatus Litorirhabdus singularis]